jgi:hypothetical protein
MNRRQFIQSSVSTTLLALGGVSAFQFYQQSQLVYNKKIDYVFLNADDDILLDLLIPIYLFGSKKIEIDISLQHIKNNIDGTISLLSHTSQKELRELLDLLASGFGRLVIAGVWLNWQSASEKSITNFISSWRESSIELLQIGYKGIHKIILGSAYAEEKLWSAIGYPGPPAISLSQS